MMCSVVKMAGCFFVVLHSNRLQPQRGKQMSQPTEVGRAPLKHFQKIFFKNGFYRSKLARELKFYTWIIIAGSKSLKKGQKMLEKATNLV